MKQITMTLTNPIGLHARPAAQMVKAAAKFKSKITLEGNGRKADAKSIIMVLGMGLRQNDVITISAEGADEEAAIEILVELVEQRFHE
ncbi:MAG: Phosphotransferase system, phosphocarrier protein HPr [Oscillospiraceae bacterium]|jgi:phosphocarrier protein|nr:Phosphotransferase system, phosphocarrier protein HPr [Oscillospiraceae bacterium]